MKHFTILFGIFCLLSFPVNGQFSQQEDVDIINHVVHSKILGEQRQIQIFLPPSYTDSGSNYPVLYLLDGQLFFHHAVSLSKTFKQFKLTPEFIVVGINTPFPERYDLFGAQEDKFIEFITSEVLPFIEDSYHTNDEKLLFGWQYAAGLAFDIMLDDTISFDSYLLASPIPIWDETDSLADYSSLNTKLYFSVSHDEFQINHAVNKLDSVLSSNAIKDLDWTFTKFSNEEHHSTGFPTLYHGIRSYFEYYYELHAPNLQKFIGAGGLDYAYAYARERGRKYGFSPELSNWSKYTIIRSAIQANDYDHFNIFADELVNDDFIRDMKYRCFEIAEYHEKNRNFEKALDIYNTMLVEFPDSSDLLKRIGNVYKSLNNRAESEKYFKKAAELSVNKE
ncbi:alpha/beta hydrolase-fold protein [Eudoraea chungangensis]|uniref:alpha/beta hydrolase-fold protein n=1 Tax=Eudoraea chungangensis TaxID=1481905 RepID=UPI0023ECC14F|nr:alpha/beta hydrolase-fold protein [Eudoraea chungangensis]